ncbi:Uncharacterized protein TCM_015739 [Theobroma cacao]|uniref:Uncharacterized protein n=1 Tax=Theobroma cacao TaxID=3641 RepID=A0A061G3P2_THECC|nr:Uncharacterized protein TCM_015739 [Theobroma cacao]
MGLLPKRKWRVYLPCVPSESREWSLFNSTTSACIWTFWHYLTPCLSRKVSSPLLFTDAEACSEDAGQVTIRPRIISMDGDAFKCHN